MIIEDLIEINRRLSHDLWNVSCFNKKLSGLSPRLIFPVNRINGEIRISEQEARILYCNILNNLNYFYSIETPTIKTYQQKGSTPLSALSDLSIYTYTEQNSANSNEDKEKKIIFQKMANVELKAHNPTKENIRKDIEKIIREKAHGNWVHILKNIDKGTLPKLFNKFKYSFEKHNSEGADKSILFHICILEKKWGMMKILQYKPSSGNNITNLMEGFFCLDRNNSSNNIEGKEWKMQKDVLRDNGWTIIE